MCDCAKDADNNPLVACHRCERYFIHGEEVTKEHFMKAYEDYRRYHIAQIPARSNRLPVSWRWCVATQQRLSSL